VNCMLQIAGVMPSLSYGTHSHREMVTHLVHVLQINFHECKREEVMGFCGPSI
jgi:hypothetical protein